MGKKISDSMNLPLKRFEGMPIVGRFWIYGQWPQATVYLNRGYYQLLQVLPDVGSDNRERWNGGGCRWFLPRSYAWLKLISRRMD